MRFFVLMGVAGCGKTSVGEALAQAVDATYIDGDALHPEANIAKMSSGIPLDDTDRAPWLAQVGKTFSQAHTRTIIGCSALKRIYRNQIRDAADAPVAFLHLDGSKELIAQRMGAREGHFMPTVLIESQFADLEPLEDDETGQIIDISTEFEGVVAACKSYMEGIAT